MRRLSYISYNSTSRNAEYNTSGGSTVIVQRIFVNGHGQNVAWQCDGRIHKMQQCLADVHEYKYADDSP